MDTLTQDELRTLSESRGGQHVSLFMSTHPAAPDNLQDPRKLKSLLRQAADELRAKGTRGAEADRLLHPGKDLVDDGLFWRPQPGGLAVFIAHESMRVFRLPAAFEDRVVVSDRFHIRPLLPTVDRGERFYVLGLSQKSVRLFLGDRNGLVDVPLGDMPRNIQDALRNDGFDEQLQFHTGTGGARSGAGRRAAIFHGSGPDTGLTSRYLTEYCKRVSTGIRRVLKDANVPVIVAAVEYLIPMYREADTYHSVTAEGVTGNPDNMSVEAMHSKAWPIARAVFERRREEAVARFRELGGSSATTTQAPSIVRASAYGQVDSLFVGADASLWGAFDQDMGDVEVHEERGPDDVDLVDLATTHTILHGGEVWVAEVAPDTAMAAILRYQAERIATGD